MYEPFHSKQPPSHLIRSEWIRNHELPNFSTLIIRLDNDSAIHFYEKSGISHSRYTIQRNRIAFCLLKSQRIRLADDRLKKLQKESWKWLSVIHSRRYRLPMRLLVYIAAPITAWQMESGCREVTETQKIVPRIDVIAWNMLKSNSGPAHP